MFNFHQAINLATKKSVIDCHAAPNPLHGNIPVSDDTLFYICREHLVSSILAVYTGNTQKWVHETHHPNTKL
jgi:hypothetical protein